MYEIPSIHPGFLLVIIPDPHQIEEISQHYTSETYYKEFICLKITEKRDQDQDQRGQSEDSTDK